MEKKCVIQNCIKASYGKDLCRLHYDRFNRGDNLVTKEIRLPRTDRDCTIDTCIKKVMSKEMCEMHYRRYLRGAELIQDKDNPEVKICSIENCENQSQKKSFCPKHYSRYLRYNDPLYDKKLLPSDWKITTNGYKYIKRNGIRIYEHRAIFEDLLNRPLLKNENVHHKNGIRHDNRIENLELWVKPQPPGVRTEDLVQYAIIILAQYDPSKLAI